MTELGSILTRLGLEGYLPAFLEEGFDTWETVLDITENDLTALHVKRGHRRRLQRAIAQSRGISYDRALGSPAIEGHEQGSEIPHSSPTHVAPDRAGAGGTETKRKYRRHPKPDENAPERPPSAYVIFSNKIRDEVRGENLSFTDIAKLVGEKWQTLTPAQKEPFETQANAAKETYVAELSRYKKTDKYKAYVQYLADFKAKHGDKSSENKRPKLETEDSGGTSNSSKRDSAEPTHAASHGGHGGHGGHVRRSSINSKNPAPVATNLSMQHVGNALGSAGTNHSGPLPQVPSSSPSADSPTGCHPELRYHSSQPSLISQASTLSDWSSKSTLPAMSSVPLHTSNTEPNTSARSWASLQHRDSSISSTSSQSLASGPFAPAHLIKHPSSEESWPPKSSSIDGIGKKINEFSTLIHPALATHPSGYTTNNHLPPLQSLESRSRRLPDPNLRALPPPTLSPMESSGSFRGNSRVTTPIYRQGVNKDSPRGSDGSRSPLENSESEAANSLAALAYSTRPGSTRDRKL
ncbi:MAG: hypothetical protein Q9160_004300 [Pyrenula sp. 1 TL-2023]